MSTILIPSDPSISIKEVERFEKSIDDKGQTIVCGDDLKVGNYIPSEKGKARIRRISKPDDWANYRIYLEISGKNAGSFWVHADEPVIKYK